MDPGRRGGAGAWVDGDPVQEIEAAVAAVSLDSLEATTRALVGFRTRHSASAGGAAAQEWIAARLRSCGYDDVRLLDYNQWCDDVWAVKPGTTAPDQVYVIGGHYDSVVHGGGSEAPGADDNASGTAGLLEAARVLCDVPLEATVMFVAFSGEEQGLHGSEAWAAMAAAEGLDIRGFLNLDMLGYLGRSRDLDIISNAFSTELRDVVFEQAALYVPSLPLVDGQLLWGSSDHQSFWNHGFPAVFFFEDSQDHSPYIHTARDQIGLSVNSFPFMTDNVRAVVASLAALARPERVVLSHVALGDSADTLAPYPIRAEIRSRLGVTEDSCYVRYRVDGGEWHRIPLEFHPDEGVYEALLPPQPGGSTIGYYLHARDEAGRVATDPAGAPVVLHQFVIGMRPVLADDFEADGGWTVVNSAGLVSGAWVREEPVATLYQPGEDSTPDPGRLCWVTGNGRPGDDDGSADVDGGVTSLLSPVFDLHRARVAKLSYARWFALENHRDDPLVVAISSDGGATWKELERVERSEREWRRVTFTGLQDSLELTGRMRLRFAASDEGPLSLVEAAVDDVRLTAYVAAEEPPIPPVLAVGPDGRFFLEAPSAASGRGGQWIRWGLAAAGPAELSLYSVTGRKMAVLADGPQPADPAPVAWTGHDAAGRRLPSGVYWLRLRQGDEELRRRMVWIR